jgi:MFS family permease
MIKKEEPVAYRKKEHMADTGSNEELLTRIRQKRAQLERFLATNRPRKRRLHNTSIFGGSLATALAGAPAIGGHPFTMWLTNMLHLSSPAWRILCAGAALCSAVAAIASQLLKSHNIEEHVTKAEADRAKLEGLEVSLAMHQIDVQQATTEYVKCVEDARFIEAA